MKEIIKKHIKSFTIIAFLLIACNLLSTLHPYVMKQILDIDFSSNNIEKIILILITTYTATHVILAVVKNLRNIAVNKTMAKILRDIREKLFNKVLDFKMITFNKYNSSELYTRLTSDVDNLFTLFFRNIKYSCKQYLVHNLYGYNDVYCECKPCINRGCYNTSNSISSI